MKAFRLLIIFAALGTSGLALGSVEPGKPAPALSASELGGKRFDLSEEKGKVVIISFFASWCESCRAEFVALDALNTRYHSKGLDILAISLDRQRDRRTVAGIMRSHGFPAALASDSSLSGFGTPAEIPMLYVIDRSGIVCERITPSQDKDMQAQIEGAVLPLLKKD